MIRLAAVALAASLAAAPAWHTYRDPTGGYSIAVPAGWHVVPRSTAAVRAQAVALKRRRPALAAQLATIVAARRGAATVPYRFEAIEWPAPKGAAVPDVTVKVDPLGHPAALSVVAQEVARALRSPRGARVDEAVPVRLAAGPAERISGSTALGKHARAAYTIYLLVRPKRLFTLAYRTLAPAGAGEEAVFRRIADSFRVG